MEDTLFIFEMTRKNWRYIFVISEISLWCYLKSLLSGTSKVILIMNRVVRYKSNGVRIKRTYNL